MEPEPQPARKVPLGPPLDLSDEELDRRAEITADDIERAQEWVRENADPEGLALWEAERLETDGEAARRVD